MFTFHSAGDNPTDDVRMMIRTLNAAIAQNPRLVSDHDPICPHEKGVADLHSEPGDWRLLVRLAERGVAPPWGDVSGGKHRLVWWRLVAHEVEHGRHEDYTGSIRGPSDRIAWTLPRLSRLPAFIDLQERALARFNAVLVEHGEDAFVRPKEPDHYVAPHELLARLRAWQVYRAQGGEAEETKQPHELIEAFEETDLLFLDDTFVNAECLKVEMPARPVIRIGFKS